MMLAVTMLPWEICLLVKVMKNPNFIKIVKLSGSTSPIYMLLEILTIK